MPVEPLKIALQRGDVSSTLDFARDYRAVNRDADLMDADRQAAVRKNIAKCRRETDYYNRAQLFSRG